MTERTTYEIVLRGRPGTRLLRPLLDDFSVDTSVEGVTRLVGEIADRSHLHGLLAHITSVNLDLVSLVPVSNRTTPNTTLQTKGTS